MKITTGFSLVAALSPHPAYVLDALWTVVAWNTPAQRLFDGWLRRGAGDHNLLRYTFLDPRARQLIDDWPTRARRLVAEFRADRSGELDHPAVVAVIDGLRGASTAFDTWWREHDVRSREGGERVFVHPQLGRVAYRQFTLRPSQAPGHQAQSLFPARLAKATSLANEWLRQPISTVDVIPRKLSLNAS